jgi:hypothetical protein
LNHSQPFEHDDSARLFWTIRAGKADNLSLALDLSLHSLDAACRRDFLDSALSGHHS